MNSSDFKNKLLEILAVIKGSGSFASSGSKKFVFPGMVIEGVGEIGFPVSPLEIKEIIKVAHKAPFGKGSETVLDQSVRSAWEIDAAKISFTNGDWIKFINGIIEDIKPELGIDEHQVTANLYKLLIYEKGDFFLEHKDSEKEKGMFGSLVVGLPAKHTGGELIIKFDGKKETIDFSADANQYKIPYAAFYADCDHEIAPVTSGYRVCLTYNLVQQKGMEAIQMHKLEDYANRIAELLKAEEDSQEIPKVILLGHQYTPSNYSMDALKLDDRPKAETLTLAAERAGYYAKLGLVTSYQVGELLEDYEYDYRSRRYPTDEDDFSGDGEMGEIYDEELRAEHWMHQGVPGLSNIRLEKETIISAEEINQGDPIEQDAEGYTGNAGMEMTYWYHYGAVFLWPKKQHFNVLSRLYLGNQLEWIAFYNNHWDAVSADELVMIKALAINGLNESINKDFDYSPLAEFLINLKDKNYFEANGADLLTKYFSYISLENWLQLFSTYPSKSFETLFVSIGNAAKKSEINHLLCVLTELSSQSNCISFVSNQIDHIPVYLKNLPLSEAGKSKVAGEIVRKVLALSNAKETDEEWIQHTKEALTKNINREYVNDVLIRVILDINETSALGNQVIAVCKDDLVKRVADMPQAPADWSRPLPDKANNKQVWAILAEFLQSPTEQVFDYQKSQNYRTEMENAIGQVTIDLRMDTIKRKSPHTLRITKTQKAYELELAKWSKDVELLKKVNTFQVGN